MTAAITTARQALVTALAATGVTVYPVAPATPIPPCVAVSAGSEWQAPDTLTGLRVNWKLLAAVQGRAEQVDNLEQLVEDVLNALPTGVHLDTVGAPQLLDTGAQGAVLVAEIDVHTRI